MEVAAEAARAPALAQAVAAPSAASPADAPAAAAAPAVTTATAPTAAPTAVPAETAPAAEPNPGPGHLPADAPAAEPTPAPGALPAAPTESKGPRPPFPVTVITADNGQLELYSNELPWFPALHTQALNSKFEVVQGAKEGGLVTRVTCTCSLETLTTALRISTTGDWSLLAGSSSLQLRALAEFGLQSDSKGLCHGLQLVLMSKTVDELLGPSQPEGKRHAETLR